MRFEALYGLFAMELSSRNFKVTNPSGGDRHGAWEWTWMKRAAERLNFVTVALIDTTGADFFGIEVWCAAEQDDRFARFLVRSWPAPALSSDGHVPPPIKGWIRQAAIEAADMAEAIPASALATTRPPIPASRSG